MRKALLLVMLASLAWLARPTIAKVDLVTLPERESVQITIYNSADLTLVRDRRLLTLKEGRNDLQFSWANTLIDPTSLDLRLRERAAEVDVMNLVFPPRVKDVGVWNINSEVSGEVPVEITAFTSGLSWQSYYLATLAPDQRTMELKGYVRVINNSGEDYENAQTRLVVGKVNLLDRIAELAQRDAPYGRPVPVPPVREPEARRRQFRMADALMESAAGAAPQAAPKEIVKEGVSEYFLYTIEGTETIRDGWQKRLPSFDADSIPVTNLYKYEQERYGDNVVRFLKFTNDEESNLGETPLPGGLVKVFGEVDAEGRLRYVGAENAKYIPVDQEVELNLGAARKVQVKPRVMDYRKENIMFGRDGDVSGFDEVKDYLIEVNNYSELPARVEITRNLPSPYWDLQNTRNPGQYEKVDQDTVNYALEMAPRSQAEVLYTLTVYRGERQNRR